jgi:hypothetical protein
VSIARNSTKLWIIPRGLSSLITNGLTMKRTLITYPFWEVTECVGLRGTDLGRQVRRREWEGEDIVCDASPRSNINPTLLKELTMRYQITEKILHWEKNKLISFWFCFSFYLRLLQCYTNLSFENKLSRIEIFNKKWRETEVLMCKIWWKLEARKKKEKGKYSD